MDGITEGGKEKMKQTDSERQEEKVFDAAMQAGHILLQNGAEISRVEETMERICSYYGKKDVDFFVLSNGIFTTGGYGRKDTYARVRHIPVSGARLDKVVAVNQLSREVEEGKYEDVDRVKKKLDEIAGMPENKSWKRILASGVGSGFFCVLTGGNFGDCLAAFLAGIVLYTYVAVFSEKHMGKILGKIFGGAVIMMTCLLCIHFHIGSHLENIISGAIMPMIPGVAFTNGIRDIADGDYISGAVRLLDAMLGFFCIAIGVGAAFSVAQVITGGIVL